MLSYLWAEDLAGTVGSFGATGYAARCPLPTLSETIRQIRILPAADTGGADAAQVMAERWQANGFAMDAVRLTEHLEDATPKSDAADLDRGAITEHLARLQVPTLPLPPQLRDMPRAVR